MSEQVQMRVHGEPPLPVLVYLPGLHGDWTLVSSLRAALAGRVRFVEFTYPRTLAWDVPDYAAAVAGALLAQGIGRGWLLAESFGSLVAWEMIGAAPEMVPPSSATASQRFVPLGLILAGGFVRHPWPWGARFMRRVGERVSMGVYRRLLDGYAWYARLRHRHAPETLASLGEFVARRTAPDRRAMRARLELVARSDPRSIARTARLPVFYLGGLVDPLVPWPGVRRWLRGNCPGYRTGRTFWLADHNVLATAPRAAAETVLRWMGIAQWANAQ